MPTDIPSFFYRCHGLLIGSSMELRELRSTRCAPAPLDVTINVAAFDPLAAVAKPVDIGPTFRAAPNEISFSVEAFGDILVRNGNEILVAPFTEEKRRAAEILVTGSGFGAILHQRKILPLHAGVVQFGESAVLFCGVSGAGKSTVTSGLSMRGFPVFSDDTIAITFDKSGRALAHPGIPHARLCEDAARHLDIDDYENFAILPETPKRVVPLPVFGQKAIPVSAIYLLEQHNVDRLDFTPIEGAESVERLLRRVYRRRYLTGLGLEKENFKTLVKLAATTSITEIRRPPNLSRYHEMLDRIEGDFQQKN